MKRNSLFILSFLPTIGLFAADASGSALTINWLNVMIYTFAILLLILTLVLYKTAVHLKRYVRGELEKSGVLKDRQNPWEKFFQIKPVGTDKDTLINEPHDGIYELDNPPPPWFMFLFYACVLFAAIYLGRYLFTDSGMTQEQEYIAEVEQAEALKASFLESEGAAMDESTVTLLSDQAAIDAGEQVYISRNCGSCHGEALEGKEGLGPNLADEYWKHGGGIKNIFSTIKYGVISAGMIPWEGQLTPEQMQQVSSYIISLEGSNPPNAKAPEGDKWVPEDEAEPAETDSVEVEDDVATN